MRYGSPWLAVGHPSGICHKAAVVPNKLGLDIPLAFWYNGYEKKHFRNTLSQAKGDKMDTQLTTLTTDHIDPMALLVRANLSAGTFGKYSGALKRYQATGRNLFDAQDLAAYAVTISDTEKRYLSAVVTRCAKEARTFVQSVPARSVAQVAAKQERLMQLDAVCEAIKAPEPKGDKTHTWLSPKQVKALANAVGNGIEGARDRVAIGLLVSAGLRRDEAVTLTFDDIKWQPVGEKMRAVLAIQGKGDKGRTVPISDRLAADLDKWGGYVGHTGRILRGLGRLQEPTDSLSAVGLFKIVRKYGAAIDVPALAPHDLRRTFAQIGYNNGVPVTQISKLLGHASIATTQRYLNLDLDLDVTASDFVPW
jgi:integrase